MGGFFGKVASVVSAIVFFGALALVVKQGLVQLWHKQGAYIPLREAEDEKDYRLILIWVAIGSLFIYSVALWGQYRYYGWPDSWYELFYRAMVKADAYHYMEIAKNGYTAIGPTRFFVVFFPLFPYLTRLLNYVVGNFVISAVILNHICLYVGCVFMYKLGCIDYGRDAALRAVRYLVFFPMAFFFRNPYTEALFFMLSAISLYYCRRHQFLLAGIAGAFCAFTRVTGMITLGVIIIEAFFLAYHKGRDGGVKLFFQKGWPALIVPSGFGGFMWINYIVTGNWFMFLVHQKEHWSNWFRLFPYAVGMIAEYMINNRHVHQIGHWVSQFIAIWLFLWLIVYGIKRLRFAHSMYNLVYFLLMISTNWLLSGARYLMCMFPALYSLAIATKKPWLDWTVTALFVAGLGIMTFLFAIGHNIY